MAGRRWPDVRTFSVETGECTMHKQGIPSAQPALWPTWRTVAANEAVSNSRGPSPQQLSVPQFALLGQCCDTPRIQKPSARYADRLRRVQGIEKVVVCR